jgi:hypothetical protein
MSYFLNLQFIQYSLSVLTDLNFLPTGLDKEHFPGAPAVTVHQGFLEAHDDTASQVLAETKRLIETKGANNVVVVGHSLGGAKAELDALMFRMVLPKEIKVRGVTFGTPRVGTPEFAAFFDSMVHACRTHTDALIIKTDFPSFRSLTSRGSTTTVTLSRPCPAASSDSARSVSRPTSSRMALSYAAPDGITPTTRTALCSPSARLRSSETRSTTWDRMARRRS